MPGDNGGRIHFLDREAFDRHLVPLIGMENMELIVQRASKARSRQEEKYYRGVVCQLVAETLSITRQEAHALLMGMFNTITERKTLPDGRVLRYSRVLSSTELDDKQFDEYIFQKVIPWAALPTQDEGLGPESGLDLYIPLPNEVDYSQIA